MPGTRQQAAEFVNKELAKWGDVIRKSKLELQ
jgi:hypothetical protein